MAFSYQFGANPIIDYPRMLIADTQDAGHIFEDSEIMSAYQINSAQFQSSQFFSGSMGADLPFPPIGYFRCAALLLDCLASNKARIANKVKVLDVQIDVAALAGELRKQASNYRDVDDNSGAFMIIEQVNNEWSFLDRFWKTWQRQSGGATA